MGWLNRSRTRHAFVIVGVFFFFAACGKQGSSGTDDLFNDDPGQGVLSAMGGAGGAVSAAGAGNDTNGLTWNTNGTTTKADDGWTFNAKDMSVNKSAGSGLPTLGQLLRELAKRASPGQGIPDIILRAIAQMPGGREFLRQLLCGDVQSLGDAKDAAFLAALYQMVVGRMATPDEISRGQQTLSSYGDAGRRTLAVSLVESTEGVARTVDTIYQRLLRRTAEPGGQTHWQTIHRAGRANSGKKGTEEVNAGVAASPEYYALAGRRYGVNGAADFGAFLRAVYLDFLGRSVDTAGRDYFTKLYNDVFALQKAQNPTVSEEQLKGMARHAVARQITQSEEYCSAQVRGYYRSLLGREGEASGVSGWTAQCLSPSVDLDDVRAGFFASPEYRDHQGAKDSGALILHICQ